MFVYDSTKHKQTHIFVGKMHFGSDITAYGAGIVDHFTHNVYNKHLSNNTTRFNPNPFNPELNNFLA